MLKTAHFVTKSSTNMPKGKGCQALSERQASVHARTILGDDKMLLFKTERLLFGTKRGLAVNKRAFFELFLHFYLFFYIELFIFAPDFAKNRHPTHHVLTA